MTVHATLRITVIEDSRESQIKFLESLGSGVVEMQAITAAPFFDKRIEKAIVRFDPDLIILDLLLLEDIESGFRVLRQLKESAGLGGVPVVVCSKFIGRDLDDRNRKKALMLGALDALPKIPFPRPEDFLSRVPGRKGSSGSTND